MAAARSVGLDMLQDGTDQIIFGDMKRMLVANRTCSWEAKDVCASCFFLETKADERLAVAVQNILGALLSEVRVVTHPDSRFTLRELIESALGRRCSRTHPGSS